jgi:hypothetical protein
MGAILAGPIVVLRGVRPATRGADGSSHSCRLEIRTAAGPSSVVQLGVEWWPVHHGIASSTVPAGVPTSAAAQSRC